MAVVSVSPETFELVNFDSPTIRRIAEDVAGAVGLGAGVAVAVNVDEAVMMGKAASRVEGGAVVVDVTGGAFESLRKAREFDELRCRTVLGLAFMRARDRLDPDFGEPPADAEVSVQLESAWASHIEGRLDRLGVIKGRPQRRIYHFRVRHGFSDTVDRVFERLWTSDRLTWADIEAASAEAAASTAAA